MAALVLGVMLAASALRAETNVVAEAPGTTRTNASKLTVVIDTDETNDVSDTNDTKIEANIDLGSHHHGSGSPGSVQAIVEDSLVPIVVSMGFFGTILGIIGIIAYSRYRRHHLANETLRSMIEKGMPITPELVDSLKAKRPVTAGNGPGARQRNDLRNGLILMGVGMGVVMLAGKPGWIVFFLGVAFLVCALLEKPKNPDQPPKA